MKEVKYETYPYAGTKGDTLFRFQERGVYAVRQEWGPAIQTVTEISLTVDIIKLSDGENVVTQHMFLNDVDTKELYNRLHEHYSKVGREESRVVKK